MIGDGGIFGAALIGEPGVFGADGGIVEAGGNGMSRGDLAVFVLQNVGVSALENAGARSRKTLMGGEASGVFAEFNAAATRFDADHLYVGIAEEIVKEADGIRAAADAGEKMRGQALFGGEDLFAGFAADDHLKIADHRGIGMRAENGAEEIVRGADVGDPIAHGLVDGVLERAAAGIDGDDLRAEHAHARDVEGLARHVFRAHVDDALEAEMRGDGGGSDAVLARARFRDNARLAHLHGQQALADGVIDFMRAGVEQIFALQINAWSAEFFGEARSELQRCWTARKIFHKIVEASLKPGIRLRSFIPTFELKERHHQRFGNVAAAVGAESSRRRRW